VFLEGLNSPFGMALVGHDLYVADTDAVLRFPYSGGETRIDATGVKVADLPAGPLNHHWTKNLIASPDGSRLYATIGFEQQRRRERSRQGSRSRRHRRDRSQNRQIATVRIGPAQPERHGVGTGDRRLVDRGQRA